MDSELYDSIYKRKSFHLFREIGNKKITLDEKSDIEKRYKELSPLYSNIKTKIKIVPALETNCSRGEEYCILLYSEKKDGYLQNIGYIGEQLDLYLTQRNIGTLWFGIGKVEEEQYCNLDFVIMIAIAKIDDETKFRKDMFKSKRKSIEEIWYGEYIDGVTNIVRYAPSSCNTQPWFVEHNDNRLVVYRYKKQGKRGIMPVNKVTYYNRIDLGIFLCFLELCLKHENISYNLKLMTDEDNEDEKALYAIYDLAK